MLPKVFKRKLRIVSRGKILFQQQKGNTGTFFVVLIMVTIIGGSFYLVNGVPPRFLVQDPLDPDNAKTYEIDEKKIKKGKHDAIQLKEIPFKEKVARTPDQPNNPDSPDRSDRPDDSQPPAQPPAPGQPSDDGPPPTSCGIANSALIQGQRADGSCCVEDGPVSDIRECCPGRPTCQQIIDDPSIFPVKCQISNDTPDPKYDPKLWCNAKPIIYLYPTKPTLVDVTVTASGPVVISDPLYPENGWKNVLAYPDGKLIYNNEEYKELFYEAAIPPLDPPRTGVIVRKEFVRQELVRIATMQGLVGFERDDFVNFWNARLSGLSSPYVLLSVFSQEAKETFDHVDISPKPDTFIEFIGYFKPLEHLYPIAPLELPQTPPERVGFTAVEWGGILDN